MWEVGGSSFVGSSFTPAFTLHWGRFCSIRFDPPALNWPCFFLAKQCLHRPASLSRLAFCRGASSYCTVTRATQHRVLSALGEPKRNFEQNLRPSASTRPECTRLGEPTRRRGSAGGRFPPLRVHVEQHGHRAAARAARKPPWRRSRPLSWNEVGARLHLGLHFGERLGGLLRIHTARARGCLRTRLEEGVPVRRRARLLKYNLNGNLESGNGTKLTWDEIDMK